MLLSDLAPDAAHIIATVFLLGTIPVSRAHSSTGSIIWRAICNTPAGSSAYVQMVGSSAYAAKWLSVAAAGSFSPGVWGGFPFPRSACDRDFSRPGLSVKVIQLGGDFRFWLGNGGQPRGTPNFGQKSDFFSESRQKPLGLRSNSRPCGKVST